MKTSAARIIAEYGPFHDAEAVHGVSFDGQQIWFAAGDTLRSLDPDTGAERRSLDVNAQAGTAFDGRHLYQLAEDRIQKVDPESGKVLMTLPAPADGASGLAWADGTLWVGQYRNRKILQIDPANGAILRTVECDRFVTGVTWAGNELWHGTWEGDDSALVRVDPDTGESLEVVEMPTKTGVSGLESDGADRFFCGGGGGGVIRVVHRPAV